MGLAKFCVRLDGPAIGIAVNGEKIHDVTGIALQAVAGHPPRLIVELDADGVLEGEGIVEARHERADDRQAVAAWLANIDAGELERTVLPRLTDQSPMVTALEVLREWATGAQPADGAG